MPARLSIGDILEVICPSGLAYVSYAGIDPILGPAIWVIPRVFREPQKDWSQVFGQQGYYAFYAVYTGIKNRHLRRVGHSIDAIRELPGPRRNAMKTDNSGHVLLWVITDGVTQIPKRDSDLSPEERQLPISQLWNYQYLVGKISQGWLPDDGDASFANSGI